MAAVGWTQGRTVSANAVYRVPIAHVWKVRDGPVKRVQFLIEDMAMEAFGRESS